MSQRGGRETGLLCDGVISSSLLWADSYCGYFGWLFRDSCRSLFMHRQKRNIWVPGTLFLSLRFTRNPFHKLPMQDPLDFPQPISGSALCPWNLCLQIDPTWTVFTEMTPTQRLSPCSATKAVGSEFTQLPVVPGPELDARSQWPYHSGFSWVVSYVWAKVFHYWVWYCPRHLLSH